MNFSEGNTLISEPVKWCMYNPHIKLSSGNWYWRYRNLSTGMVPGKWSDAIAFEVKDESPVFVSPKFDIFRTDLPQKHPRLYCFVDSYLDEAKIKASSHPEYKALVARAQSALEVDYTSLMFPFSGAGVETVAMNVEYLYQAFLLTDSERYLNKIEEILLLFIDRPYNDAELFKDNFSSANIAYGILASYDLLYEKLSADIKLHAEKQLYKIADHYFSMYSGMEENHVFDNHFWQKI